MCATVSHTPPPPPLTLDEKIGQLFSVGAHAVFMSESSESYQKLRAHVRDNHVGGIIWFVSNVYETAVLTERLQREAKIPLLISADLESGIGMRLLDTTYWPQPMAVAATGDPSLAEKQGRITARDARLLGINHILAPVADVNVNAANPVINTRSYGEDPAEVSRYVRAFIRGVQAEGLLATAKHFPGHGDTHVDSHRSLPVLDVTRERLDRVELVPFRAAIEEGVASIMTGHLGVPVIDPAPVPVRAARAGDENPYATHVTEVTRDGTMPATLSRPITTGLLREAMGFDGLIVTDALDMGGLVEHLDAGEGAVRAIEAGADQILKPVDTAAGIRAIRAAVGSGRLSEARIDESVARIVAAKKRAPSKVASPEEIFKQLDSSDRRAVAAEIARRAITLAHGAESLPIRGSDRVVIVVVTDTDPPAVLSGFERELRTRAGTRPKLAALDSRTTDLTPAQEAARDADVVVLALAIRAVSGAGRLAVPESARRFVSSLPAGKRTIAISFGSPYVVNDLPPVSAYICAWGVQPVLQVAAARAIYGEQPMTGKLPVTLR